MKILSYILRFVSLDAHSRSPRAEDEILVWRERILHASLIAAALVGPIVFAPGILFLRSGENANIALFAALIYASLIATAALPRRMFWRRTLGLFGIFYCFGIVLLFSLGAFSTGFIWLFVVPVFACTVLGPRAGAIALLLNGFTVTAISLIMGSGVLGPTAYNTSLLLWAAVGGSIYFLNVLVTLALAMLMYGLSRALVREKEESARRVTLAERLEQHVQMERLVKEISTALSHQKAEDIDQGIQDALERLGRHAGVDRAYISTLCGNSLLLEESFEWCAPGVARGAPPRDEKLDQVSFEACRSASALMIAGEPFVVNDVAAMDGELAPERQMLESQNVRATVNAPFVGDDIIYGFIGFDMVDRPREWREEEVSLVVMAAEVFARVLQRRRDEARQRILEDQVRQIQNLDSLGVLAGGIAHDFNNLLMGVQGYAELLRNEFADSETAAGHLDQIFRASENASELCRKMLAYSGETRLDLRPLQLSDLGTEVTQFLSVSFSEGIDVVYELSDDLPEIQGDKVHLQQIVLNLVTNAVESIGKKGGRVTIRSGAARLTKQELSATCFQDALDAGDYVYLEVEDTGEGMTKETQRRVFEPFFSTKFQGRGLGMAAMLGILRKHRGAIDIQSQRGVGTVVRVYLPADAGRELPDAAA